MLALVFHSPDGQNLDSLNNPVYVYVIIKYNKLYQRKVLLTMLSHNFIGFSDLQTQVQ